MAKKSKFKTGDRVWFKRAGDRVDQEGAVVRVRKDGSLIVAFDADPPSPSSRMRLGATLVVQPYEVDPISTKEPRRYHATKKSPAQLGREIAEALSQRPASSHAQRPAQSLGHLSWLDRGTKEAYEHDGQVYIARTSDRIDPEGYRYGGRWTSSLAHWKRGQQESAREIAQALVARRSRSAHATKRLTPKTTVRGLRDGQYTAGTGLLVRKIKALGAKVTVAATGRVTVVDKKGSRHVYVLALDPSVNNSPLTQALTDLESSLSL